MGFIQIEALLDGEKRFAFELESDGIYTLNCLSRTPIQSLDKIWQICILRDMVILRMEDRDFRDGRPFASWEKDQRRENNITAYDWQGNRLWNIGEIVGDIKAAFLGVHGIFRKEAEKEFGIELPDDTGQLLSCFDGCWMYLVDATNKRLIHKFSGKF